MIELTRFNGNSFAINSELILYADETPDTILTLTTGEKLMVRESLAEVIDRIVEYRKRIYERLPVREVPSE